MLNDLRKGNGMASVMMSYYDGLLAGGIRVDFLVLRLTGDEREKTVRSLGSRLFVLPVSLVKYSPAGNAYLRRLFEETPYDIVHVNMPGPYGAWVLGAAGKAGVRQRIYHCHNPREVYSLKARLSSGIYDRLLTARATQLMACSRSAGESVFGKKPFTVLENCIDTDRFAFSEEARRAVRAQYGIPDDCMVVGAVARLENQKNPLFALACFAEIAKRSRAFLLWVGDGSLRGQMEEEIRKRGLSECAALVRSADDVAPYYSAFDIFLLPSKYEGLGIVFLEAQANGLPVYGSKNVPDDAAVTKQMKRLSLRREPEKWAAYILSRDNRRADTVPETLRERYDIRRCSGRLAECYCKIFQDDEEQVSG